MRSRRCRLLFGGCPALAALSAKTLQERTQLSGSSCRSSSGGPEGAWELVLGSIRLETSIAAVRSSFYIVVIYLMRCFVFAKTFVAPRTYQNVVGGRKGDAGCIATG